MKAMPPTDTRLADAHRLARSQASKFGANLPADAERLARAAAEALSRGDSQAAFALADRRCRLLVPAARDFFLRAEAHRAAGRLGAAQADLGRALALDPTDAAIDAAALAWGDEASQIEAAQRVAERASTPWRLRRRAIAALLTSQSRIVHRLRRKSGSVSGWIAWAGAGPFRIEMSDAETLMFDLDADPDHPLASDGVSAAELEIEAEGDGLLTLRLRAADGEETHVVPEPAVRAAPRPPPRPVARSSDVEPFVTIIVPVYEDEDATRACLETLAAARPPFAHRVIVADDASPNPALRAHLDAAAARGEFELIRNPRNLGFAATVNAALRQRERGDALLLNADTLLPPGAVERLHALSRFAPDVGAITPFSNNGELTSYPLRNEANPLPDAAEVVRLDARARAVNGDALVDIPNGVGFCLYITQACLEAVGELPELYAQGYYEDVEFCLAARERGFRNVAAPGVFVGHAGSRSFAARKRALVMRNLQLVEARFPGYRLETAAFVARDPLKPYRAALDAASPPAGPVTLIACGAGAGAAGRRRAEALVGETALWLAAEARGLVALTAIGGGAPQSLAFDFADDGAAAFADYLGRLNVARMEWLDPAGLPEPALAALSALAAPVDLLCAGLSGFAEPPAPPEGPCAARGDPDPCEACRALAAQPQEDERHRRRRLQLGRALERARAVVPLDRLAESFALRVFKTRAQRFAGPAPAARGRSGPILRLGALYSRRDPATERLLRRLARRLAGEAGALVVFGSALDDSALLATGSAFVTGPVAVDDLAELAGHYGIDGWLAPDRGGGYGEVEAAACAGARPMAYFDGSFGAFPVEWGDLSLDPRICDDKAAARIAAWMNGETPV
jgi:GT2 family glycosyltransferase